MGIVDTLRTVAHLPLLLKLKKQMVPRAGEEQDCIGALVARNAERLPDHVAYSCEGTRITWRGFNDLTNRYANAFLARGIQPGDTVSVMMENRIDYLAVIFGLNKVGATAALLNTNLTGRPLEHCIATTNSTACVVGAEKLENIEGVRADLSLGAGQAYLFVADGGTASPPDWAQDFSTDVAVAATTEPAITASLTLGTTAFYIFTSGTTGMPKAAVMSNKRYLGTASLSALGGLRLKPGHCMYNCLPLYHATGLMVGVGAGLVSGAATFIRRKFSASNFLADARREGTTHFIYIGELCRYLLSTPDKPDDANTPLHTMMGNGLRPDVWHAFKKRFGFRRIAELYGASEGNAGFCNILNKDCTIGTTLVPVKLARYDVHEDRLVRDSAGHCIEVPAGEAGLALIQVSKDALFEGYTNAEATEKKIVRDAFESGDCWFNTGDLLRTIDVGFAFGFIHFQFVDRVGDTFRWKGENVSTNEVAEILNLHPQVDFSNVYGVSVPGTDGKAGMASLTLAPEVATLDLHTFSDHVTRQLPAFARPVFLRVQTELAVTGTFKLVKGDLREQGFDPALVKEPLYVMLPGETLYQPLTPEVFARIQAGEAGF
ncbi:MAG: long-chain-acyl-CoA synthetase [Pseudomonadales bacterium]|nr:long-chain-acyl-CoA synthetase [Pseudomonadales bacterium]